MSYAHIFMTHRPLSSVTIRMNLFGDKEISSMLPKTVEKQISTYEEDVNFLLKSYVTDPNITKDMS